MRIIIELEQHELQVAKELIDSLRSITDQLQIRTANAPAIEPAAARAPTPPLPLLTPIQTQSLAIPAHVAPALPTFQGMPIQPPPGPTAAPAAAAPSPQGSGRGTLFATVLQNFTDASQVDSVVANLNLALSSRQDTSAAMSELVDAFEGLLTYDPSNPGLSLDTGRVERYFMLLNHKLPDHTDAELRKGVLQRVVRHLTKAREVACDRAELWPAAVGFGCLVALECVKITGALVMIERQLGKPTTVAAAATMLGNVLSMCGQLVCAAPGEQVKVWQVVDNSKDLKHPCFAADRTYFASWRQAVGVTGEPPAGLKYQPLGPPPVPTPAPTRMGHESGAGAAGSGTGAVAGGQWSINQVAGIQMGSPAVAIAWDSPSGSAIVSGTDGSLGAWDTYSGQEKARVPSPAGGLPVSLMATGQQRGQVLLAANPAANSMPGTSPYLALHDTLNPGLPCRAACARRGVSLITSVLLQSHDTDTAVSCETWPATAGNGGPAYPVCLWNNARLAETGQAQELTPLHTWMDGHTAPVGCSAASQYQSSVFFTGAADGVVRVWDTRMRSPAGSLQGTNTAPVPAHAGGGIAVMECQGHVLVTGGSDAMVCIWDVRALGQPSVNALLVASPGVPVYKLAYRDSPSPTMAAIALGSGLYLLDWTSSSSTMTPCPGYHEVGLTPALVQHDIVWAPGSTTPTLLSISAQPMMSVFAVRSS